ncbi:amino acid permease [Clostridium magnum]|uniref:GABA permease n=1 Tax=Clostridium magnum DSM 2767 TaxID=1121326 RepID=A0A161XCG1_9CLOT|nr:amino acid permease [Clostridium magnum]KZL91996.1 GABA permease [Clostridium magnum DSM 2767]SHH26658.1 L-asparagine transporter [Clostridium magnum DSM 2767]
MEKKHQGLSAGHLTMMALGSVIGGSFFIGTAVAINAAGPVVLISYILGGILIYFILYALSEMTVANPHSGSFRTLAARYFGPGTGFVVGWVYWTGMILSMSSEATAVSILIRNWFPNIAISLMGSLIIIGVTLLNLLGARRISKVASSLSAVKLLAIVSFIVISILLVMGVFPRTSAIGIGELAREPLMPGGVKGIAGSMLIVIFAYAGFEIIALAASEAANPEETIPKAIRNTVLGLVGLYILSALALLPLVLTSALTENMSPMVTALNRWGMGWVSTAMNLVLMTAILSASLASMFGIGRMMRSLADEDQAPKWLKDKGDVPYRGMIFSGFAMLLTLWLGLLFPRMYLFLISSGGFALLFTYAVILAIHIRFRKMDGCPPEGKCQMPGFPYSSWLALIGTIVIILSMPIISGQGSGLIAGIAMVSVFSLIYVAMKFFSGSQVKSTTDASRNIKRYHGKFVTEFSRELTEETNRKDKVKPIRKRRNKE